MNRKVAMLGVAMMAGIPHVAGADDLKRTTAFTDYSFGSVGFDPRYGVDVARHPFMEHLSMVPVPPTHDGTHSWQLGLAPPPMADRADDPLMGRDKRVGVTLKLNF